MCLYISPRKRLKFKNGRITLYKVVLVENNSLNAPYWNFEYHSGFNYPIGSLRIILNTINGGAIHVCTSKAKASKINNSMLEENKFVVIPVTCYKKDLIAEGLSSDAAFSKIFISKEVYRKALKAKTKWALFN